MALARNHTAAFVSFSRRVKQIRNMIDHDPNMLIKLSSFHDQVHSPAKSYASLGFSPHPSGVRISHYRDPLHLKIVYHCDPGTIFQPAVDVSNLGSPPQPPAPALLVPDSQRNEDTRPDQQHHASSNAGDIGTLPLRRVIGKQALPAIDDGPGPQASGMSEALKGAAAEAMQLAPVEQSPFDMSDGLLRRYILQAISPVLEDSSSAASAVDGVYSMPFSAEALQSLSCAASCDADAGESGDLVIDVSSLSLRSEVFLQLVRREVGDVVVPASTGLKRSDWAVSFLKVNSLRKIAPESLKYL